MKNIPLFKGFTRLSNQPLDDSSIFESFDLAKQYVENIRTSAYENQLIGTEGNLYIVIKSDETPSKLTLAYIPDEKEIKEYVKQAVKEYSEKSADNVVIGYINKDPLVQRYSKDWLVDLDGTPLPRTKTNVIYITRPYPGEIVSEDDPLMNLLLFWNSDIQKYQILSGNGSGGSGTIKTDQTIIKDPAGFYSVAGVAYGNTFKSSESLINATTITILEEGD